MSEAQQEISKLEQDAKNLVNNLNELHNQVGSYKTAKDGLEKTNSTLLSFIEATQELAKESHKVVEVINKIGSGKIFKRLGVVEKGIKRNFLLILGGLTVIIILQVIIIFIK